MNWIMKHAAGMMMLWALILVAAPAHAEPTFELIGNVFIHSVSDDGTAAAALMADNSWETVHWTADGGLELLGMNALYLVGRSAGTPAISADGTRVSATIATMDSTLVTAGLWTEGEGWQELYPPLPPDGGELDDSLASSWGLSGDGDTVVGLYWRPGASDGSAHAFSWTEADGHVGLGSQGRGSRANGVNRDGSVVVGYTKHPVWGGYQPTVWEDGEMIVLAGDDRGGALRTCTSDGTVLAGNLFDPDTGFTPSTLWFKNDTGWDEVTLGVLPGTFPDYGTGIPLGMSDDVSIVVGTNRFDMNNYGGFIWTAAEGMLSPEEFFEAYNVPVREDFVVISFSDVTPDGNVIVGYGFDSSVWNAPMESFIINLGTVSAVPTVVQAEVIKLGPAHPNPFNPSTSFALTMERPDNVRLEIFDARGRLVRVLQDGVLAAGDHVLRWDGNTDMGMQAASGLYLARASTTNGAVAVQRMTLVK